MTHSTVGFAPVSMETLSDPAATAAAWARWVARTPLADTSKRTYDSEVRGFVAWLADQTKHVPADVFTDPMARDYAVRDYRRHLLTERKRQPKGVDSALTAIGSLFGWLGLGAPAVPRASSTRRRAPKALIEDAARDVLRAAERRGPRDLALVSVGMFAGLRAAELHALDVDDYVLTERKGEVVVRAGKGDKQRTVPLNKQTRDALRGWAAARPAWKGAETPALFLARTGERLAIRSIRHTVDTIGKEVGLDLHPHMLRHTFGTSQARSGTDVIAIADLMGHADVNTVRGYAAASDEDMAEIVEKFSVDF